MTTPAPIISLVDYKAYAKIETTDPKDDAVISAIILAAIAEINRIAGRQFGLSTETRLFDVPTDPKGDLIFDLPLTSVTTLTNGDGEVLTTTDYVLLPANITPKYAARIKPSSTKYWKGSDTGNTLQAISIAGVWGEAAPDDIKQECKSIVKSACNRRFGENSSGKTIMTAGGVLVAPEDISDWAMTVILSHRRVAFG